MLVHVVMYNTSTQQVNNTSQETGVTVAEASIGAVEEFPEGKPYRVDKGPNAARKRARDTMAPLNYNNHYPRAIHERCSKPRTSPRI